jgi:hypothetical protein
MHTYGRPAGSGIEHAFIDRFIRPTGAVPDLHHNWHLTIGHAPIIWSCHLDTAHLVACRQSVHLSRAGRLWLDRAETRGSCLGADDTVGVFLCLELIRASIPGHYIFHHGEECGCQGSGDLAWTSPELLDSAQMAIALDRAGTTDVITHQMGQRTCSDLFAQSLADQLNLHVDGFSYRPCDRGVYTDTAQYATLIPECTNLSVGYTKQHSIGESVDTWHVFRLLDALLRVDVGALAVDRDPALEQSRWVDYAHGSRGWRYVDETDDALYDHLPSTSLFDDARRRWLDESALTNDERSIYLTTEQADSQATILAQLAEVERTGVKRADAARNVSCRKYRRGTSPYRYR